MQAPNKTIGAFWDALLRGGRDFGKNPLGEIIVAMLFILFSLLGFTFGLAAMLYLLYLDPLWRADPAGRMLHFTRYFQSSFRLWAGFLLGGLIWLFLVGPMVSGWGIVPVFLLVQPLWIAILLVHRFDLSPWTALGAAWRLFCEFPATAFSLVALGMVACAPMLLGSLFLPVGNPLSLFSVATLPIAFRAMLYRMEVARLQLAAIIQQVL